MNRLEKLKNVLFKSDPFTNWFIRNAGMADRDDKILEDSYSKSDLVYICVSTTARAISQVPMVIGRVNSQGEWEAIDSPDENSWEDILKKPNYLQDYSSFIESIVSFLMLDGNAWVAPYPIETANPFSLWVIQKKHMKAIRDSQTEQLLGWNYMPSSGMSIPLEIADVAHIFFWDPNDPIIGLAPAEAGKISIVTDYKAAKFNQVFFDQGATIGGVVSTEQGLTETQYNRLKEQIDKKYSGYEKSHRMLLLDGGLKFMQTSPSHKDIMFPDLRALDKERILQIYGMKKAIISVTDDLNRATAWQQERSWWKNTNIPIMKMIASAFNFTYFEKMGLEVRFDISTIEALQDDFSDKIEMGAKLADMGFTANEINERLELGFEEKPWRDYFWVPFNVRPVGDDAPAIEEEPPPEELPAPGEPPQLPAPEDDEEEEEEIITPVGKIELKPDFKARGELIWKDLVGKVRPIEESFKNKTRRFFFEWRQSVLSWLYSQGGKAGKADVNPFILTRPITDIDELAVEPMRKLKKAADGLYKESLMMGLETLGLEIGEVLDIDIISMPESVEFLKEKLIQIKRIGKTQSDQLKEALRRGMEREESLEQIANRFKGKYGTAANRARTIARTEVYGSVNFGRNTTIKQTAFRKVQWFTAMDEKVRTAHRDMHGKTKKVGAKWNVGGDQLRFPADPNGSPGNIINCRCIEMVVLNSLQI